MAKGGGGQSSLFELTEPWQLEWRGMPECVQEDLTPAATSTVSFADGDVADLDFDWSDGVTPFLGVWEEEFPTAATTSTLIMHGYPITLGGHKALRAIVSPNGGAGAGEWVLDVDVYRKGNR